MHNKNFLHLRHVLFLSWYVGIFVTFYVLNLSVIRLRLLSSNLTEALSLQALKKFFKVMHPLNYVVERLRRTRLHARLRTLAFECA